MNKTLRQKLTEIQTRLKAPKSQYNSFGKYYYRTAEDIQEAVKPLLEELDCSLTLSDKIILIGDRYYVEATAVLSDESGAIPVSSSAREEEDKKGMDGSQITGASSSYARKYALNGLFLIDDTKDSDSTNTETEKKSATKKQEESKKPLENAFNKAEAEFLEPEYTAEINAAITKADLDKVYDNYPKLQKDPKFIAALKAKKAEVLENHELNPNQLAIYNKFAEDVKVLKDGDTVKAKKILASMDEMVANGLITEESLKDLKTVVVPLATI